MTGAKPMAIIDSHQHVFWHGRDHHGLVADMDEHGIQLAWLLSWEVPPFENDPAYYSILNPVHKRDDGTHAGIPLTDLLRARDRYPERFVVGYCIHPSLGNAPDLLRAAVELYDVRICGEWKFRLLVDDPRSLELFHAAGELNLPVILHLDVPYRPPAQGKRTYQPLWYGGAVENLERALQACPETTFVGHAPGFWREISEDAAQEPALYPEGPVKGKGKLYQLLDRYPNLCADLSARSGLGALRRDPGHALCFLTRFSERLLFGRDCYGQELHRFLQSLPVPGDVAEKIYYRNAQKLLGNH